MSALYTLFDSGHRTPTISLLTIFGSGIGGLLVLWFTVPAVVSFAFAATLLAVLWTLGSIWLR